MKPLPTVFHSFLTDYTPFAGNACISDRPWWTIKEGTTLSNVLRVDGICLQHLRCIDLPVHVKQAPDRFIAFSGLTEDQQRALLPFDTYKIGDYGGLQTWAVPQNMQYPPLAPIMDQIDQQHPLPRPILRPGQLWCWDESRPHVALIQARTGAVLHTAVGSFTEDEWFATPRWLLPAPHVSAWGPLSPSVAGE